MSKKNNRNNDDIAISEAIDLLTNKGVDLSTMLNKGGLLKQLTERPVEKALAAETDEQLGYSKDARADTDKARNGASSKNPVTANGLI